MFSIRSYSSKALTSLHHYFRALDSLLSLRLREDLPSQKQIQLLMSRSRQRFLLLCFARSLTVPRRDCRSPLGHLPSFHRRDAHHSIGVHLVRHEEFLVLRPPIVHPIFFIPQHRDGQ